MLLLKHERLRRGWSQTRICQLTGIAPADISLVERGLQPAYPAWRRRLARVFRLPAAALFTEVPEEAPASAAPGGARGPQAAPARAR
jgi:transcriptional regulator with XRE-family HTH domain